MSSNPLYAPVIQRGGGLERAVFRVPAYQLMDRDPENLKSAMCSWYGYDLHPESGDILRVEVRMLGKGKYSTAEVTLTLKRGHYVLAALVAGHESVTITKEGRVTCSCHAGQVHWIMPDSLPTYYKED